MKIAVIHLSDIHIKTSTDWILERATGIAAAAKSAAPCPDAYLLAVTGDVAFSGKPSQYDLAKKFFDKVKERLSAEGKPVFAFYLPGNHDLDFDTAPDTRPTLLAALPDRIDNLDLNGATVHDILSTQEAFYKFEAAMLESVERPTKDRLMFTCTISIGDEQVLVNCFNTAWVSTNPEVPARLLFPREAINIRADFAGLVISAFHHPYNWLEPENAKLFRHQIETSSDVVMTGHEHESSIWQKEDSESSRMHYVEGAVLQDPTDHFSGFNVVLIDTGAGSYEPFICKWSDDFYNPSSLGARTFVRNKHLCKSFFRNNSEFRRELSDPGAPILHPRKHDLKIDDVYVCPALTRMNPEKKFEVQKIIESRDVVEYIRTTPQIIICGEELSGKTILSKRLYRDLQEEGDIIPVLLDGEQFAGFMERDIKTTIRRAIVAQYDEGSAERFFQLDLSQRALIVDDWHKLRYSAKRRAAVIGHLKTFAGKNIILTNRLYAFEELAETSPIAGALAGFQFCEIKAFGRRLTGKLIEKWHSLETDFADSDSDYAHQVASSEHKINVAIRTGLLPTYPIFLIGLLQADAHPTAAVQNMGSYGHILEAVITGRIAEVSKQSTDVGMIYTYASRLAYALFKKDAPLLSSKEMQQLHSEYRDIYKIGVSEGKISSDLIKAKILHKEGDSYRFAYKGSYCYFVARYFQENLPSQEVILRPELNNITDRIGWEDYTNIVMFYLYLTRDAQVIERLLANAAKVYGDSELADLEEDVRFVNRLLKEKPKKLVLPPIDIDRNRDVYRAQQDEADSKFEKRSEDLLDYRVPYETGLAELTKVTIALQNLRVMGQVLRNFPGVLPGEPMYRLAEASYRLGLRTLRRFLSLAEQQFEGLRVLYGQLFLERNPLATAEDVANTADQKLIWLTSAVAFGMIKRICNSVGIKELQLTFEEVRKTLGEKTSIMLVDLAIELEYFRDAPVAEILDLEKVIRRDNLFAYRILHDLVVEYLYLHNTDTQVFQRLGSCFEIQTSNPKFFLEKAVGSG